MKKVFPVAIGKHPALALLSAVMTAWLWSSSWSRGKDWSAVKDLLPGKDAEAYYESGVRDFQSGARQVAVDELTKAIELDPTFTPAYEARAGARLQMKDYTDAIADCDKVIGLEHDDERIYLIKGVCRFYLHDMKGARNVLSTAISLNPDDPLARDVRGLAFLELRDWDKAAADFNKAIQLNPDDAKAYYGRAAAEFFLKDCEKSLADASDALEFLNNNTLICDAYGLRADVKTHLKDRAGALADVNARLQLDSSDEKGYVSRGNIEALWDDFSDASNDLQTAIQINPTNSEIYLVRGMLEQKCGGFKAALTDYSRGLANDREAFHAADIDEAIGYAYAEMGQWPSALGAFRQAIAFKSPPKDVPFQVFLIECRLGQSEQAKKELTTYIQSIPAAKAGDWATGIAHFLAGTLGETNFLAQATTTAKRSTDISMQTGDAWYFAGMQHLLAGDKAGASERFRKCLKVGDDNSDEYMMARSIVGEAVSDKPSANSPRDIVK
jgi:tetratricopeptide (TPR) repeat protein